MAIIPQIMAEGPHAERLGVPEAPRVPTENPVWQQADEFGAKIGAIGDVLQEQQTRVNAGKAVNAYAQTVLNARINATQQPYDPTQPNTTLAQQRLATFNQATDPAPFLNDPANAHIAPLLQVHLPEMRLGAAGDVQMEAVRAQEQSQLDDLKTNGDLAAHNMVTASDPQTAGTVQGTYEAQLAGAVKKGTITQGDADLRHQQFLNQVAYGGLQQRSLTDPSGTMVELSRPDFLQRNPNVTPEQQMQLRNDVVNQNDFASKAVDSSIRNDMATQEGAILTKIAAGQPYAADLADLRAHYSEADPFYRSLTGTPWVDNVPSAPGLTSTYQQQIKNATPDTIDQVASNIDMAVASRALNPKASCVKK